MLTYHGLLVKFVDHSETSHAVGKFTNGGRLLLRMRKRRSFVFRAPLENQSGGVSCLLMPAELVLAAFSV